MEMPLKLNIAHYCLEKHYQKTPEKTALIISDGNDQEKRYTYEYIYNAVAKIAKGLRSLRYPKGTKITIRSTLDVNFILLYFGTMAASLVPISTLAGLKKDKISHILKDSDSKVFYEPDSLFIGEEIPNNCQIITDQDIKRWLSEPECELEVDTVAEDDAFIIYTSGSTGNPKGVVHAHRNVLGREPIRREWLGLCKDDLVMITGKPCWTYSMGVGFIDTWATGATTLVNAGNTEPQDWLKFIEQYKVSLLASNPSFFKQVAAINNLQQYDMSSLRTVTSAGEKLPIDVAKRCEDFFGVNVLEALGMTEMSTFVNFGAGIAKRENSVGKLQQQRNVAIVAVDDPLKFVELGEVGQLALHTSNLGFMKGYLHKEQNQKAIINGEWFLTGDLMSQDGDGYFYHHGRCNDVLNIAGGHRVSPVEVESAILKYPEVIDVACTVRTVGNDNLLVALVVLNEHKQASESMVQAIKDSLHDAIEDNHIPKEILFVNQIPRNPNGKIIRAKLAELL